MEGHEEQLSPHLPTTPHQAAALQQGPAIPTGQGRRDTSTRSTSSLPPPTGRVLRAVCQQSLPLCNSQHKNSSCKLPLA